MARLNEEFQLTFHEADSSICIGFEEEEQFLPIGQIVEVLPIPIVFEESTSRIPVNIADKEEVKAWFADVVVVEHGAAPGDYYTKEETDALLDTKVDKVEGKGLSTNDLTDELVEEIHSGGGHKEVRIYNTTGEFTPEQIETLRQSPSNYISYNGQIYKLQYKNTNTYKYFSLINDVNNMPMITVDFTTNRWQYNMVVNGVLDGHINDNERHINPGERDFWNNKLNYDIVQEERLILNRN